MVEVQLAVPELVVSLEGIGDEEACNTDEIVHVMPWYYAHIDIGEWWHAGLVVTARFDGDRGGEAPLA